MEELEELDDLLREFGVSDTIGACGGTVEDDEVTAGLSGDEDEDGIQRRVQARIESYVTSEETGEIQSDEVESDGSVECEESSITRVCNCKTNCLEQFTTDQIEQHKLSMQEIDKNEREMFIMGCLMRVASEKTTAGKRKRTRYRYMFDGKAVCKSAFMYINEVGSKTLKNILKHLAQNGPVPRVHGNTGKKPAHALRYEDVKNAVDWLLLYADVNGLPMPAAPRGKDGEAPVLLPTSLTKKALHQQYDVDCRANNKRSLGLSAFKTVWKTCIPHVRIMTPKDDVCHKCQTIRHKIMCSVSETDKLAASRQLQEHVEDGQRERAVYMSSVREAEEELLVSGYERPEGPVPPTSTDLYKVHYTFDYMQNVTIPHHSQQMGPLYFVTGRKLQVFAVRLDSSRQQYNYIIDEDQSIGPDGTCTHGPNSVISMLHHCLYRYGLGEQDCLFHAGNAAGQNKNRYVVAYMAWRVINDLNRNIKLLMAIPGHTKCLVDGGFGRIKKVFKRSDCDTTEQFAKIINKAGKKDVPVLFKDADGEQTWNWYDWKSFLLRYFLPLRGIQKYHSFRFTSDDKGFVYVKERSTAPEQRIRLLKRGVEFADLNEQMPETLVPAGLTHSRQLYLYRHVRPFVREPFRDLTCPGFSEE